MEQRFIDAVKKIPSLNIESPFCFLGSSSLFLHGIAVKYRDLDVITYDQGIQEFSTLFRANIFKDKYGGKQTEFRLKEVPIHVEYN